MPLKQESRKRKLNAPPRLSTFVHTNVLLANLRDRKYVCDTGTPFSPSPQAP